MTSKYLKNYFNNENPVINRLTITNKLISRLIGFMVCTVFFIISNCLKVEYVGDTIENFAQWLMIIGYVFSFIGIIFFGLMLIFPKQFNKIMKKWKYEGKERVFKILDWLLIIPICVCISVCIFTNLLFIGRTNIDPTTGKSIGYQNTYLFVIQPITGGSMLPNFESGERILLTSDINNVKRGHVVVIDVNREDNYDPNNNIKDDDQFIKRVIGVAGDRLTWINEILTISNDQWTNHVVNETYGINDNGNGVIFNGSFKYKKDGESIMTDVIPEGYVFVMGDNRGSSYDSRQIGLVPIENIVGIVRMRFNGIIPKAIVKRGILE